MKYKLERRVLLSRVIVVYLSAEEYSHKERVKRNQSDFTSSKPFEGHKVAVILGYKTHSKLGLFKKIYWIKNPLSNEFL